MCIHKFHMCICKFSIETTFEKFYPQGECVWLHLPLIKSMTDMCRNVYENVQYAYCTIPTYPSGQVHIVKSQRYNHFKSIQRVYLVATSFLRISVRVLHHPDLPVGAGTHVKSQRYSHFA